jgi:hypothetical protein
MQLFLAPGHALGKRATPYAMGFSISSQALSSPGSDRPGAAGDTIATAQATNLGPADGIFSATAKIGDGLYPLKDVDRPNKAERAGFEPAVGQAPHRFSRPAHSAALAPLRRKPPGVQVRYSSKAFRGEQSWALPFDCPSSRQCGNEGLLWPVWRVGLVWPALASVEMLSREWQHGYAVRMRL